MAMRPSVVGADPEACLAAPRHVVATRCGDVEYAERGDGPPLLTVYGSPGGCHQGLIGGEAFRADGFRVIAPSRPDYLGTPLATGASCPAQAEAMVGLLDALEVDRVAVLGISGGGRCRWRDGYANGMAHFGQLAELPLTDIACPTMIVHGTEGWDVTPKHAAHERISDSRLEWITGGTHPGFLFSPGAQAKALAWLTSIQV